MLGVTAKKVRDVMSHDVIVVGKNAEVHELQRLFVKMRIHGVPVVDASGKLVGVVSQTDLLHWHYQTGVDGTAFYDVAEIGLSGEDEEGRLHLSDIRTATVEEVMTPVAHVISPDDDVSVAADRMLEAAVHRLIVVDREGTVRGILSAMDLLRLFPSPGQSA